MIIFKNFISLLAILTVGFSPLISLACEPPVLPFCGNGILEGNEQCDDGNLTDGDGCSAECETEEEDCLTIFAHKVVCQNEEDLPNWALAGTQPGEPAAITSNTAIDFVNNSQGRCWLEDGWDFQWGWDWIAKKQPGDHIGPAPEGTGWHDFDKSTGINAPAEVKICNIPGCTYPWVRENLEEGYVSFANPLGGLQDDVSAEMLCHNDMLNFDNYDHIANPKEGETYYCVAFNSPIGEPQPFCGDGIVDAGEQCDDGNIANGDGCSSACQLEQNPPEPYCGDGIVNQQSEQCDDGNNTDNDGCSAVCQTEIIPPTPFCGDGVINQLFELCDDGNTTNGDGCSSVCNIENPPGGGFCGDGQVAITEQCDDGNNTNGDGCTSDCRTESQPPTEPYCGDGIVNGNEECDGLAGVAEGQTCSASCVLGASTCNLDLDVMMIMDVSGSMGYENPSRLSQAKIAANGFLDNLRNGDQSGLVSFGTNASLKKTLSNDHANTQSIINGLTAHGATNIGEAINAANNELISVGVNPDVAKIEILLTDGRANQPNGDGFHENPADIALAISKSLEAAENGIMIFTIGLGGDINSTMLQNISANTGGQYYLAPDSSDLNEIFNQIAFEICKTGIIAANQTINIFNARILSVGANKAVVSWYTNIPATSRVVYDNQPVSLTEDEPNYGYGFSTPEQDLTDKVIYHSVTITGLVPGNTYFWRPISHGSPIKVGEELFFTTSLNEEPGLKADCIGEGESIPVIASPPACCAGLEMIPPKEEEILGISGICTANCGNGTCDNNTESFLNCPQDCKLPAEISIEGVADIAGVGTEKSNLVNFLAAVGKFISDQWLILVSAALVLFVLYWIIFERKKNKNTI